MKRSKVRNLEWMKARRAQQNKAHGLPDNWSSDALDCFLEGYSKSDIAEIMSVTPSTVDRAICKEALFRLMTLKAVERLEDMELSVK